MTGDATTIDRVDFAERERVLTLLRAKEAARGHPAAPVRLDGARRGRPPRATSTSSRRPTTASAPLSWISSGSSKISESQACCVPRQKVAAIGNVLRHGYQSVGPQIMWEVATRHVSVLRDAVEHMLHEIGPDDDCSTVRLILQITSSCDTNDAGAQHLA
jgi:hypothetical protein